ncbi:MAG: hypothetical protein JW726_04590, partial [Anaerolineales bacterium]|nr:hypothetical protein [Anaerolineales bacterium]
MIPSISSLAQSLLVDQQSDGGIPFHPYHKWLGAHWVLACLAELGYPQGDERLRPLLEQCYTWLLSKEHEKHIRSINGRVRRCASQEGNCVYYSLALGLADERTQELAERLMQWQWADGGWNCDKNPAAATSSFNETLIPLRGLSWYARHTGDRNARVAIERAADVFLKRQLFRRLRDGSVIEESFTQLFFPYYWHYDILIALKVMAEAGYMGDPRCESALDLLESKRLQDGGFPAERRYYHLSERAVSGKSRVDWGGTSVRRM